MLDENVKFNHFVPYIRIVRDFNTYLIIQQILCNEKNESTNYKKMKIFSHFFSYTPPYTQIPIKEQEEDFSTRFPRNNKVKLNQIGGKILSFHGFHTNNQLII